MRILITGVTGFAGGHLAEALLEAGAVEVAGISRRGEWPAELAHLAGRVGLRRCDLADPAALDDVLRESRPEQVYHLAGYTHAGQSFKEPAAAWRDNLEATRGLYDALDRCRLRPRVLHVSSGLVYGDATERAKALDEDAPMRPASPYAASKAAADLAAYQYSRSPGLAVVRVRPFNHIGPRQSARYAVASFARQLAALERGQQPAVLETGNLGAKRDLTDVRDMVRAYVLLMERGRVGEVYNASAGWCVSMQEVLDRLRTLARVRVEVRQRADLMRSVDTAALRGNSEKLRRETGWRCRHSLEGTLADTLEYWRQKIAIG